jgi:hypothetical protein
VIAVGTIGGRTFSFVERDKLGNNSEHGGIVVIDIGRRNGLNGPAIVGIRCSSVMFRTRLVLIQYDRYSAATCE